MGARGEWGDQAAGIAATLGQPGLHPGGCATGDENEPFLVALAAHAQRAPGWIVVVKGEPGQLGLAQAGGVENIDHRSVAQGDETHLGVPGLVRSGCVEVGVAGVKESVDPCPGATGIRRKRAALLIAGR